MIHTIFCAVLLLGAPLLPQSGNTEDNASKPISVADLVAKMKEREKSVDSVLMEMVSRGSYPGGVGFEIKGTVRVLGKDHFSISNRMTFDDDLSSELDRVVTPEGSWIRERDPAFGEVFLKIEPELMQKLERAQAELAVSGDVPATMDNPVKDPLGSAMLQSLNEHFDLTVQQRSIKGRDYFVVNGPVRDAAPPSDPQMPVADRVELLVRAGDYAVVQMTQFEAGKELMQIEITRLELGVPMDPSSFVIHLPDGAHFIDVMEHPPAAVQIRQLLQDAETKRSGDGEKNGR